MRVKLINSVLSCFLIVSTAAHVSASGFAIIAQGAHALSMAGAYVAGAKDPSAIYYNPAAISSLPGTQISLGSSVILNRSTLEQPAISGLEASLSDTDNPYMVLPTFFLTSRASNRITVGLGVYRPFGFATKWDWSEKNPKGREWIIESNLTTYSINPVLAYQINDRLSLAAGYQFVLGNFDFTRYSSNEAIFATVISDVDGTGTGFNGGLHYIVTEDISFGLSYRSSVNLDLTGENTLDFVTDKIAGGSVTTSIALPSSLAWGINWVINPSVTVEANAVWMGWSSLKSIDLVAEDEELNHSIIQEYQNKTEYRFGVQYNAANVLIFRLGYFISLALTEGKNVHPIFPDSIREAATIGVGWTNNNGDLTIEGAIVHVFNKFRVGIPGNLGITEFGGRYQNSSDGIMLSVHYKVF